MELEPLPNLKKFKKKKLKSPLQILKIIMCFSFILDPSQYLFNIEPSKLSFLGPTLHAISSYTSKNKVDIT